MEEWIIGIVIGDYLRTTIENDENIPERAWSLVTEAMRFKQWQPGVSKRHAPAKVPGVKSGLSSSTLHYIMSYYIVVYYSILKYNMA